MRILLTVLVVGLVACSTDPAGVMPPGDDHKDVITPAIRGQLLEFDSREGYGPALVALQRAKTREIVDVVTTDAAGNFLFEALTTDPYIPVVYDRRRRVLQLPATNFPLRQDQVLDLEILMGRDAPATTGTDFDLTGRVTDAVTGEPIFGAIVEVTSAEEGPGTLFSELEGRSSSLTQPTDADGRYTIARLPGIAIGGQQFLPHARVSHPGYVSQIAGGWNVSIFPGVADVALQPGQDSGAILGRVVNDATNQPMANVAVAVEWRRGGTQFPKGQDPAKTMLPVIARSDADGVFLLAGLPAGGHVVRSAFETDDGWVAFDTVVEVTEATTSDMGDVRLVPALTVTTPADGEQVTGEVLIRWDPVPDMELYGVFLQREEDGAALVVGVDGNETAYKPSPEDRDFFSGGGTFVFSVSAFSTPTTEFTWTERRRVFRVGKP